MVQIPPVLKYTDVSVYQDKNIIGKGDEKKRKMGPRPHSNLS